MESEAIRFDPVRLPAEAEAARVEVLIAMTWPRAYGGGEKGFLALHVVTEEFLAGAPKLTIQGGTREILRGIVGRGLGLR